jgi:hypothetical protein
MAKLTRYAVVTGPEGYEQHRALLHTTDQAGEFVKKHCRHLSHPFGLIEPTVVQVVEVEGTEDGFDGPVGKYREVAEGEFVVTRLPHSEVCMHMQVSGRLAIVQFRGRSAQIYKFSDGSIFSGPITAGEAGFYYDEFKKVHYYYVPSRIGSEVL